jgi:hypothetical protein
MKVIGETFSFHQKRKRSEEVRYQKYLNFQAKGPLPDRTLESFIPRSTDFDYINKYFNDKTKTLNIILKYIVT